MSKLTNQNKITLGLIGIIVVLVIYVGYLQLQAYNMKKDAELNQQLTDAFQMGQRNAVTAVLQQSDNCQATTLTYQNFTRTLIDVACLQQQQQQAQVAPTDTP